jgi:hypothetical protein
MLTLVAQTTPQASATPAAGNPTVVISTSVGDITVELFKDRAPVSVENFLQYVKDGFYSGTIFHRVVRGYVVQGGGFDATLTEKPTRPPIQNEATNGLRNWRERWRWRARARARHVAFYVNGEQRGLDHRGFTPATSATPCSAASPAGWMSSRIAPADRSAGDMEDVPVGRSASAVTVK